MQALHVANGAEVLIFPARLVDATNPLPSCNGPPGELGRMASLAASRLLETPGDHGQPASHQTTPDSALSLVVTPEHLTVSAQHHAAAVTRPRGSSPFPCAGPVLGYD